MSPGLPSDACSLSSVTATTLPLATPASAVLPGQNGVLYVETDDLMDVIEPGGTIRDVTAPTSRASLESASLSPDGRQLIAEIGGGDAAAFPLETEDFSELVALPEFTGSRLTGRGRGGRTRSGTPLIGPTR